MTILKISNLSKNFPGVRALSNVNFELHKGEIHALAGENGAGKSTLTKIICGNFTADSGEMFLNGKPFSPSMPAHALAQGVRAVYQEFNLMNELSIAENLLFEQYPHSFGIINKKELFNKTKEILQRIGLDLPPEKRVGELGIAQMQLVEIGKAIAHKSEILILDEPTATLTDKETTKLFSLLKNLRDSGVSIIYISHRLQELIELGDRITVLRNGEKIVTREIKDTTVPDIIRDMVGRSMEAEYPFDEDLKIGAPLLNVKNLTTKNKFNDISFTLSQGEILGVSGLVGSGRTEIMRATFGADKFDVGEIELLGRKCVIHSPQDAIKHGMFLLTEDRKNQGLLLDFDCTKNISLTKLQTTFKYLLNKKEEVKLAKNFIKQLAIKTPSEKQLTRNLSGGNQQKVVLAKCLNIDPRVIILDEPTRGIDVGARYEIYELIIALARKGTGLLIVSSDLLELMGVCHRIIVISNGRISGELSRPNFEQNRFLELAYKNYL